MKLADRILGIEESPTLAVSAKASAMKAAGIDVIDFSAGEPDFPTPENVKNKGMEAIRNNFTKYTPSAGVKKIREGVALRYQNKYGQPFSASEVILCNGAKQALFNIIFCLVQEGDEVIIPQPYWVTFPEQVRLAGGVPVFVPTDKNANFVVKADDVEKRMTPRTKILLLNSPNNPSGAVIPRETMGALVEICLKRGVSILFDECYDCFIFPPYQHSSPIHFFPKAREITFVVNTFSKVYSMTGWRLGFAIGSPEVIAASDKLQGHMTSNPSSISQMAGIEALEGDQSSIRVMFEEYERRRKFVLAALSEMKNIHCNEPQGAFYAFPDISAYLGSEMPDSVAFCQVLLEDSHVALVAGSAFGMEGYVRISYATSMDNLKKGCERIQEFLRKRL